MTAGIDCFSMTALKFSTLIELLRRRALSEPGRTAYLFLQEGEGSEARLTYAELDRRARAVAALLQMRTGPGERALLLYPAGLDYVAAFFGCLYAGIVAVPAYPPRRNRNLNRLQAIARDAQATLALTLGSVLYRIECSRQQQEGAGELGLEHLRWIATDELDAELAGEWREPEGVDESRLAYLQYTSGSTAEPKGVMVSHGNVLHNSLDIHRGFAHTRESVALSWLPHFHDMGLVDGIIQPLYGGFPGILMSPASFLQRPFRWLEAVSHHRVTHTGGPNFAYDLCVRRINEGLRGSLDLSSWRVAYNGAEPVRRETLERFAEAFRPCGFRWSSFYPAYGLAEATLKVSGGRASDGPTLCAVQADELALNRVRQSSPDKAQSRTLVGAGRASAGTEVRIVNPETRVQCGPEEVGEVWARGPGVARGYWNRPDETERTFHAHLSGTGEGPFLRTGDLGFLKDETLYITGRLKDLIIIRGRNHYPQDIELTVERSHTALRPGAGAAFSIDSGGEEMLVLAQEVEARSDADWRSVIDSMREAVADEFEVRPAAIVLLKRGSIPKTSSGKIRRAAARTMYLERQWEPIAEWRARGGDEETKSHEAEGEGNGNAGPTLKPGPTGKETIEDWLRETLAAKLKVAAEEIDVHRPMTRYGVDSLLALELLHSIEGQLGAAPSLSDLLGSPSISRLAALAFDAWRAASSGPVPASAEAQDEGRGPGDEAAQWALSHNQQALWFLHSIAPESAAYNLSFAARIPERIDVDALRRAFRALVERHPSLRTTFPASPLGPTQRVNERPAFLFEAEDASGLSHAALDERLSAEAHRPFDLESGPLFRVLLFRRSENEHVLLLTAHHIIADFWSLAVLMRDLATLYGAEVSGTRAVLPAQAARYTDYVRWQREMLASERGEELGRYWREQLSGELMPLDLPADRTRPAVQTFRGASLPLRLDAALAESLRALAKSHDATLYMTLLSAFLVLLYRYTGQRDLLVGSPTSGRTAARFSELVGYLVNPVVLRGRLSGRMSFAELLDQMRGTVLAAFEHQDYPFDLLVRRLQPERDPARSPLFQVMFALHKAQSSDEEGLAAFALGEAGARIRLGGLALESLALDQRMAQFDLSLTMAEEAGGRLVASFEYNTDLFDRSTIRRMSAHFRTLLESIAGHPAQSLAALPLLESSELEQLLSDGNAALPHGQSCPHVHRLFERQAELAPAQTAVARDEASLSYGELNARANMLAHYLRSEGVRRGTPVALCMERSIEILVGLLGILKAGGAYVPLDPSYPAERLDFMLDDSDAPLLLTEHRLLDQLPATRARIVCLDQEWRAISGRSGLNPEVEVDDDDLAYVIYTSGSTGRPKGVMVRHGSLSSYTATCLEAYAIRPSDRVLQFASFSFDASAEEVFACLAGGATLLLRSEEMLASPSAFVSECASKGVTVLDLPTAFWHQLAGALSAAEWEAAGSLRLVIIGGERALPERLSQWLESVGPRIRLVNSYGPTESTIVATLCDLQALHESPGGDALLRREVPIGRPITGAQCYILDQYLRPVPIGVTGELCIGGAGLSRGYLKRPALTAEKFIPHPFSDVPGARLYRTGDLVRRLPDGNMLFVGRLDQQVKIRGFRIEPGEIESALLQHEGVRDAAVLAVEEQAGEKRLVAYLVAAETRGTGVAELRGFLKERLPDYMLPSAYVFLDRLPLTPSGKVDQRALRSIEPARGASEDDFVAPQTRVEQLLSDIWAEVLRVKRVGVHDNFFELGGDSILSIQVIARARQAGINLPARQMFAHPTIAELAASAGVAVQTSTAKEPDIPVTGEVPLTPIQRWFFEQELADPSHWNMAALLEARAPLDAKLLERAFASLLVHHDALRSRFTRESDGWHQLIAEPSGEGLVVGRVELSALSGEERSGAIEKAAAEMHGSLDITRGPLLRAALFDQAEDGRQRLLIVIHHLVMDAVSWRVLLEDLTSVYGQLQRAEAIRLPPRTTSFKTWAESLCACARSAELSEELNYWSSPARHETAALPSDGAAEITTEANARTVSVALDAEETGLLLQDVPAVYHTQINDVLLTALALAFKRWTGNDSLLIELEGHGREEIFEGADLSRTVGWFTSAFPVLLRADAALAPGESLKAIKEELRSIPGNGIGYGLLRYLSAEPEIADALRALPVPQVSFNYLGQLDGLGVDDDRFALAPEAVGPTRGPGNRRTHLLEINASVRGRKLRLDWTYSEETHAGATIQKLARDYLDVLRAIIRHCLSDEAGGRTPSDFPLARLDQRRLDELLKSSPPVEDIYTPTPMQQGMLFHSIYAPEKGTYTGQLSCVLHGDLDAELFRRAWQRMVARHEILRAAFLWENLDEPLMLVQKSMEPTLDLYDWRAVPRPELERRLGEVMMEDRLRGFDLARAPLIRLKLIRVDHESYRLILTHHHLLLDGWSLALLLRELFSVYESLRDGVEPRLEGVRPFRDYVAWLKRHDTSTAERFWRETLKGFKAPTALPFKRAAREADEEPEAARREIRLSPEETERLRAFSRRHRLTLNTLVQGAYAMLLARYGGEPDVLFGATVSGRPPSLAGVDSMIGLFINTLPVRVRVPAEASALEWLKGLQSRLATLRDYEFSSLAEVQGWSEVPRGTPLFESLLVFENYPVDTALLKQRGSLKMGEVRSFEGTNYPLTLVALPGEELELQAHYDEGLFESEGIQSLLRHLRNLLLNIVSDAGQRLADVELIDESERRRLLFEWNQRAREYPKQRCVHELFEEQAERTPESIALVFGERQVTYRELDERAGRLAQSLRGMGVGPESCVGLLMERSVEMVVGLLGVLKAGAGYLPLDPSSPAERLLFMIDDACARVLLVQSNLSQRLEGCPARVVVLDSEGAEVSGAAESVSLAAALPAGNLKADAANPVDPDNLAYVIYTSGSTGRPKGVQVTHRGVVRLVKGISYANLDAGEVLLQFAPISFDASTFEIWGSLLNGARLVLMPPGPASLEDLGRAIRAYGVTTLWLTAGLFHQMVDERLEDLCEVRQLLAGGDVLSVPHVRRYLSAMKDGATLVNGYGPTESTTFACTHRMDGLAEIQASVPIGRPIENTEAYLLDESMRPVPAGVAGHLYLGGDGLARGYLNRAELTAEKFIPHPFSTRAGARLYKTGDMARWLTGGELEFLGRTDEQVKIRGFRIEPGEIEAVLCGHTSVREAVVIASDDAAGEKRLAAYVVLSETESASAWGELRGYLRERLPEYMVPSIFIRMDQLPLTPNGKVNRRALPDAGAPSVETGAGYVAPRNAVEEALADIWREVLGLERVGVHDDFFELGGHSLMATRVLSQVRRIFRLQLPLPVLFETRTIAELAQKLARFETKPGQTEKIAGVLSKLKGASAAEIKSELDRKRRERNSI